MARRKNRFPMKLPLLPGPNKGKLIVEGPRDGGWLVQYDVETPEGRWVYDRAVLTTEQLVRWTGVSP